MRNERVVRDVETENVSLSVIRVTTTELCQIILEYQLRPRESILQNSSKRIVATILAPARQKEDSTTLCLRSSH